MSTVSLVSVDSYRTHQFEGCVADYQRLIWMGLTSHPYLDAARIRWGLDGDSAQLALYEAEENS